MLKSEVVTSWLFAISNALLLPVIVILLLLLGWSIVLLGEFVGGAMRRRSRRWLVQSALDEWQQNGAVPIETFLAALEVRVMKRLESAQLILRLGPIFGLVGTLIPLGPALQSLARGEMVALVNDIRIAFATTVVGLIASAIAFVVLTVQRRWYAQDLTEVERLLRSTEVGERHEMGVL
ncbi:MAG: MotA/TolQ/ExbB proton channel family protein [Abditibacteriales bacterium]|nr:MotA/TolQ/ExbB proton channel family protein [Abditibacteriales bacterium]MDW8366603.1 MotA/TolQ/ExbB proton channel family protein [Abditibacteriales bacterium]